MAIRIRKINGHTIALCAYESDPMPNDVYLDDNAHHALSTKFDLDFTKEGFMPESHADPILTNMMKIESIRDCMNRGDI